MEPTSHNDWLTQVTGKSVSEYRQQLVQFGNQLITRQRATQVIQRPASLIKVAAASLPPLGFMRSSPRRFRRPPSGICCQSLSGTDIGIKFAGVTPSSDVTSFTGINGTFDAPGGPTDVDCFWGSVYLSRIYGTVTYNVIPGDPTTERTDPVFLLVSCNPDDTLEVVLTCARVFFNGNVFDSGLVNGITGPNIASGSGSPPNFSGGTFEIL